MIKNFTHRYFEKRTPSEQIGSSVWIISAKYMHEIEAEWLKNFEEHGSGDVYSVGTVSDATVSYVTKESIGLNYLINRQTRFHYINFHIPISVIKEWVGIYWNFDHKLDYIFVDDDWHEAFWNGQISAFLLVDAIGMKEKLAGDFRIVRQELNKLSLEIDAVATKYPDLLFISAADNVIVRANFSPRIDVGEYRPEILLDVCSDLFAAIKTAIGCEAYGVFTQGFNFYNEIEMAAQTVNNHVNTRSLGEPYRQLFDIDLKLRGMVKNKSLIATSAYFSSDYFFSLNLERDGLNLNYSQDSKADFIGRNLSQVSEAVAKYKERQMNPKTSTDVV